MCRQSWLDQRTLCLSKWGSSGMHMGEWFVCMAVLHAGCVTATCWPRVSPSRYRGVDFEGGKYPCNDTFLLSAGQGITFSTAIGRNFES